MKRISSVIKKFLSKDNSAFNKVYDKIKKSKYFDNEWYLEQNEDVKAAGLDPLKHYLLFGANERRDASSKFSTIHYVNQYPDVTESGLNPLFHYLTIGRKLK